MKWINKLMKLAQIFFELHSKEWTELWVYILCNCCSCWASHTEVGLSESGSSWMFPEEARRLIYCNKLRWQLILGHSRMTVKLRFWGSKCNTFVFKLGIWSQIPAWRIYWIVMDKESQQRELKNISFMTN